MNPGIWESLIPATFDTQWHTEQHGSTTVGVGGFGLGQWTNVGTTHGRLYKMSEWATQEGLDIYDGETQAKYMLVEDYWAGSSVTRGNYNNLNEFLNTASDNLGDLVWDFLANWEGMPDDHYNERLDAATVYLDYINAHMDDDPELYTEWYSSNAYLPLESQKHNVMCLYFYLAGVTQDPKPIPLKKNMPVWMMCRYFR